MRRLVKRIELNAAIRQNIPWFRRRLEHWFESNRRVFPWRDFPLTPYQVLIAEILLRRTQARSVPPIYDRFLKKYPNFSALAMASKRDLYRLLKPLGLWRQKANILTDLAKLVEIKAGKLPSTRSELEKLPHIGNYIASVVLTTFHGGKEPFVDVNMARVVDRFFGPRKLVDIRDDPYLHSLAHQIVKHKSDSLLLNWAVLDFAALVCQARRPRCSACPMTARCSWYSQNKKK